MDINLKLYYFPFILIYTIYWIIAKVDAWKLDTQAMVHTNQDVLYTCPLISMCQCASQPNETSLLEINCNEVSLYKFPEFLHSTVKNIEIAHTFIQSIDDDTFQGLHLESVKLVDNKIQQISERSFSSMTHSLIYFDISGNSLQTLCLEAIRNIQTLSRLIAQRNNIEDLNGNWGNLVDSLRSLHMSGNLITELITFSHNEGKVNLLNSSLSSAASLLLPSHSSLASSLTSLSPSLFSASGASSIKTFSKLRKLVWFDLSENRISHIDINLLPQTLVTIDLSRNILSTFPADAIEHLHDLKILSLKDNLISKVPDVELLNNLQLEKLDLSLNIIETLSPHIFNGSLRIKAINFEKNFLHTLSSNVFHGCGIVHMVLAFNYIQELDSNAFHGLEWTLEYLDLERNQLKNLSNTILSLNHLRYLYLTANEINYIENLPSTLRVLSLSSNNFTNIPADALLNCSELTYLNMGYNKIADLPENIFMSWGRELQTLLLRNNKITSLNYGAFNGLEDIKEISLSFNDIHYVHPGLFINISKTLKILELSFGIYREDIPLEALSPLTELMWLGLDNNNLKFISDDSLISLRELTYLNIAFNRISVLPRTIFVPEIHKNLMDIDISYNVIERIFTNTFDELVMLQYINLASNKIKFLEKHSFHNLPFLTYVDLSYNNLINITDGAFAFLPNFLGLDLMFNNLNSFSLKIFRHVSNSTTPMRLNISNNEIIHFDGDLSSYLYVYSIDASNNLISDTTAFINLGQSLRVLYLSKNNFTVLNNHAFGDLIYLEILNLSKNNITLVRRRSFQGLINLQEMDLSNNKIEQLQFEQFSTLKKLRILNIRKNRLKSLPTDAFINTRIEFLDVSENFLTLWPVNAFSDIGFTLRCIKLDNNQLEYLDAAMFSNTNYLHDLSLSHNQITVLPDNTFSYLNNLTTLDISFNPLVSTNFKELFLHLPRLRQLNLKSTGLYAIPQMTLPHLTELDVSQNFIEDVLSLKELHTLRILRISENKITNLIQLGKLISPFLRVLDLSKNPIRKLSRQDLSQMKYLDQLSIEGLKLPIDIFADLKHLRTLKISAQVNFGEIVSRIKALRKLYISVITDDTINDKLFAKLINNTKLNLIEITGKHLKSISANAFYGLSHNHDLTIRIRQTQINDLPAGIFYTLKNIPRLSIDLSDNIISTLSPDSFYPNASTWDALGTRSVLGGLDLSRNPLQCDCGLVWLGHWLRRWLRETTQVNLVTKEDMNHMLRKARRSTCLDPLTGKKLPFLEIFPEDLLCHASALSSFAQRLKAGLFKIDTTIFILFIYIFITVVVPTRNFFIQE